MSGYGRTLDGYVYCPTCAEYVGATAPARSPWGIVLGPYEAPCARCGRGATVTRTI